jgi:hypothetical protein
MYTEPVERNLGSITQGNVGRYAERYNWVTSCCTTGISLPPPRNREKLMRSPSPSRPFGTPQFQGGNLQCSLWFHRGRVRVHSK